MDNEYVQPNAYTPLKPFKFWCQTVLPTVYDDSLSYYELLCKVVEYLNTMAENVEVLHDDVEDYKSKFNELKSYVDSYFDNLDVQEEINAKLDEMATNGVLAEILNNIYMSGILNVGESFNYQAYKNSIFNAILSYLVAEYYDGTNSSIVPEAGYTPDSKYYAVYRDGNTYMGVLGQGEFEYTDTKDGLPVLYIDCSGFVSLITKNIPYDESVYKDAFDNVNTANYNPPPRKAQASGDSYSDMFTMDFSNRITTYYMAEICEGCGMPLKELGQYDSNTGTLTINEENVNALRTGDIIFFGNSGRSRYKGIHHCAIYLKDLNEISEFAMNNGFRVTVKYIPKQGIDDNTEYGYIAHVDYNSATDEANVIKIQTLYQRMFTSVENSIETTYGCRAFPAIGTSNKYNFKILGMFSYYDIRSYAGSVANTTYTEMVENYPPLAPYFKGNTIGATRGEAVASGGDLNSLTNGVYSVSGTNSNTVLNGPWKGVAYMVTMFGGLKNNYGVMVAYNYESTFPGNSLKMAYRVRHYSGAWSPWQYPTNNTPQGVRSNTDLNTLKPGLYLVDSTSFGTLLNKPEAWDSVDSQQGMSVEYIGGEPTDAGGYRRGYMVAVIYSQTVTNPIAYRTRGYSVDANGNGTWGAWHYVADAPTT